MAESQNIVKESLGDKESRLLRELEELKQAKKVTELEHELAELKASQRIKELEHDVEERKRAEKIRKLERQVEEPQKRRRLNPESSCDVAPTHDLNTQSSAKIDHSRDLVPVESTACDDTPQAHCNQPTLPASISSDTARNDSPAPNCPNEASTPTDPPHSSALAQMNNRPSSNDAVQQEPSTPISISAMSTNTRSPSISEVTALKYYQELDGPADDSPELLFYDMNLEELYEFASISEGNQEKNVGDLKMLSRLYYFIFTRTSAVDDIQKAIQRAQEVLEATHADDPDYAPCLRDMIVMLLKKHECTSSLEDLDQAILFAEVMITATPSFHPERSGRLMDLVKMKMKKALQTGSTEDHNEAMVMFIEARGMMQGADVNQASHYFNRFKRTGDISDLNIAIARDEEAITVIPHNHPGRVVILNNLASFLSSRFKRTGDISDLNIGIARAEEAVAVIPHDYPDRAAILNNLANSLLKRFEQTGDISDLNIAIARGEEAIAVIPHDYPDRAAILSNLAGFLLRRFERTSDISYLNIGIARAEEAVAVIPHDYPDRAAILSNLASSLWRRFERTGDISDLNIAIARAKEAVAATPHNHPDRADNLSNLATSLFRRFEQTGDISDLNIGIARAEEAVAVIPHDYSDRAAILSNLASSLSTRFKQTGAQNDSEKAIGLWVEATELPNAAPNERIGSASKAAKRLADNKKWAEASRITEIAVNLLPTVAPRQLKQQDQQHILGQFAGLAALAASTALEAGKEASQAVQLLELGRGIIAGLRFGTRSDLTKLREQHPQMAEKFERLRDILDSPSPSMLDFATVEGTLSSKQGTNQRHNANLEFDDIVSRIRCLPNFEHFLLPPQVDELKAAASQGPVVLINISEYRCDAFLVEKQAIRSIRLPALRQSDIQENVELMRWTRSAYTLSPDAKGKMSRMLEWLWDVAVGPILDTLGFRGAPSDGNWPRIWWIPTGPLSSLPLHAAGRHFPSSIETALDRVVSSYSPSIKALLYARQNSQEKNLSSTPHEALLVSMDTTSGHSDLRFAGEEVDRLASILSDPISKVTLVRPPREAVLSALSKCTIFHFAGHGESHLSDPSRSSLLVSNWQENPLTVEHLMSLNLREKSPCLAYLSACSTSESNVEDLHDEAIHLVTACQLAGFQHVVGSLWEVSDRYSVDIAEEVYKTIVDGGTIDSEKISLGVHKAARRLRDITQDKGGERTTGPSDSGGRDLLESGIRAARRVRPVGYKEGDTPERSDPLIWAAYIHVGP